LELHGELFSGTALWFLNIFYGVTLLVALRMPPWRRLFEKEQLHVFLGACVVLIILWHVRGNAMDQLSFHFLGVTTFTLMFGWSFGIIGTSLALLGVTLNGSAGWEVFAANELAVGIIPVTITQLALFLIHNYLPRNFFIYVLGNGFITAGLAATVSGYFAAWMLISSGAVEYAHFSDNILPFFPLIFFPEAFINGWAVTILVCYRPHWIPSFSDALYIKGK
jgi:uncharacterized membrane protein